MDTCPFIQFCDKSRCEFAGADYQNHRGVGSVAVGILQWRGVKWGSTAQLLTAAMKTAAFIIVVGACFLLGGTCGRQPRAPR